MGTPTFGTVDFSSIWTVVAALITFLSIPLAIKYGIVIGKKAVGAVGSAMGGGDVGFESWGEAKVYDRKHGYTRPTSRRVRNKRYK